ncbi:helix-turn-helix transcriptional regulator [Streptomyces anulatus]|uniref:LuxR C-terminal-related transcriptional regulator n=1 Tax=Streptomyces anulatus TaxID=1892 RepID=UPI00225374A5|nr:helix-turn-helix transcriptional regulator [Streptomyces anulatus]MCX4487896.1 helix-turn-helix transcriptional regulator [Streptomyces anulatus]
MPDPAVPPTVPKLDHASSVAYRFALERGRFSQNSLVASLGLSADQAEHSVDALQALRLIRPVVDEPDHFVPVSPEAAAAQLVTPVEAVIRQQQSTIERVRSDLMTLQPLYHEYRRRRQSREAVDVLDDTGTVLSVLTDIAQNCKREVLTIQPGGGRPAGVLEEAFPRDIAMLERGVSMKILYEDTARFNVPTQRYARQMERAGALVRTTRELPSRLLIFDRETAVIPLEHSTTGAVLSRQPSVVDLLLRFFDQLWSTATGFGEAFDASATLDQVKYTIAQLLAAGHKDEFIARRLGISVRTCRRHIAEIMQQLNAESRFQAGYILSKMDS